jgi:hypothetical protein
MMSTSRNLPVPGVGSPYSTKYAASAATVARRRNAYSAVSHSTTGRVPGRMLTPQLPRGRRQRDRSHGRAVPLVSNSGNRSVSPLLGGSETGGASLSVFEPDILLPSQFFATLCKQAPRKTGECQLLIAVLDDAVHCFQKYSLPRNRRERRLFEEAQEWMMCRDVPAAEDRPTFSFEYVCEVLSLDPEYLRCGLKRWRNQQLVRATLSGSGAPEQAPMVATA